jgi:hypothetical protein
VKIRALLIACLLTGASHATAAPERVLVGAYVNDIQNLDVKTHSFAADIYLWFKWKSGKLDPAQSFEFINPSELWGHVRTKNFEQPLTREEGLRYQLVRVQGRFGQKFPLDRYPFDHQTLAVELEDGALTVKDLVFEADRVPITVNPRLVIPGFALGTARLVVENYVYPTNFGDMFDGDKGTYSRIRFEIPIYRPMMAYAIKLILPIFCVVFCASLIFLFHPNYVDSRMGVGITALLTIVALQITLNEDLPDIGYLVLIDKIYLCSYVFVILALAIIVRTTQLKDAGQEQRAIALNHRALWMLVVSYLATVTTIVTWALR